jgi:hypothetical protein
MECKSRGTESRQGGWSARARTMFRLAQRCWHLTGRQSEARLGITFVITQLYLLRCLSVRNWAEEFAQRATADTLKLVLA